MAKTNYTFGTIGGGQLARVTGGSSRVAASSRTDDLSSQMQTMLTQISQSIQALAQNKNNDSSSMMLPMMMMMMGGGGGGGGAAAAPAPAAAPPPSTYVSVNVRGRRFG